MGKLVFVVLVLKAELEVSKEALEARVREHLRSWSDEWEVDKVAVIE